MKKNYIAFLSIVGVCLILVGTLAYFYKTFSGSASGDTGYFSFNVYHNESIFENIDLYDTLTLKSVTDERVIMPGDKGEFTLDLKANGSSTNVVYDVSFSGENIPTNMRFYVDDKAFDINSNTLNGTIYKSNNMAKSHTIKWEWPYAGEANDDIDFVDKEISININIIGKQSDDNNRHLYEYISSLSNNGVDTNIDFTLLADSSNGEGINIMSGTENNMYPIYYYRGDINNNNIIFANYCWLIVRTTETGGVKLLYNGVPNDGKCDDSNVSIGTVAFNSSHDSPTYVGYMYGLTTYDSSTLSAYKTHLEDTSIIDTSNTSTETIGNKTFNIAGRHTQNAKSSTIKIKLDTWYQNNIEGTEYESILEDTVWCNDRSISTIKTIDNFYFDYAAADRLENSRKTMNPSLNCTREVDKFTVNSSNGNGDLEYPIGLLTADEIVFAGNRNYQITTSDSTFINKNLGWLWLLTPSTYKPVYDFVLDEVLEVAHLISVTEGSLIIRDVDDTCAARPSISLRLGTRITGVGDGTSANPYRVVVE